MYQVNILGLMINLINRISEASALGPKQFNQLAQKANYEKFDREHLFFQKSFW